MLKALGMEHWMAKELACSRKGYWRMAQVLNQIFSKKIIARLGYTSMSINVNIKMYIFDHLRMYIFAILPLDRYIFSIDRIFP